MEPSIIQDARHAVEDMSGRVARGTSDALAKAHDVLSPNSVVNVSDTERVISAIVGSALISGGLARRSFFGVLVAVGGGALIQRALTGHCAIREGIARKAASEPRYLSGRAANALAAPAPSFQSTGLPYGVEVPLNEQWPTPGRV